MLLGLSHHTAPVEVRERLALTQGELTELLKALSRSAGPPLGPVSEVAVLSTCNRFEVYALASDSREAGRRISALLAEMRGVPEAAFAPHLFWAEGEGAARHLMAVAAGLDSMILGEPQVLGQVTEAYEAALASGAAGAVLAALFRQAIHCGKRARHETTISEHAASISHAAVELARQMLGSLAARCVLLIGAGEMAQLAARNLRDNGAARLLVVNRSPERGRGLAERYGGEALGWEALGEALAQADIVLCSAAAPHTIIHTAAVREVMAERPRRSLFLIDIGVPRNVDAGVARLGGVYLYDIDDLETVVQGNLAQRQAEVPRVNAIAAECSAEFDAWLSSLDVTDTIRDLRSAAQGLEEREVARALRRLGPVTAQQERVVRMLARSIVNKLLHSPTVRLKERAAEGQGEESARLLRDLFDLPASRPGRGARTRPRAGLTKKETVR